MDTLIFQLPNSIYGWIAVAAAILGGIVFIRQQGLKSVYEANKELRQIVEDRAKEIETMKVAIKDLQDQVAVLQKANKTFEDLIITALKQYFFENPTQAKLMEEMVKPK